MEPKTKRCDDCEMDRTRDRLFLKGCPACNDLNTSKPGDVVNIKVGDKCPACDCIIRLTPASTFVCDAKPKYAHRFQYDRDMGKTRMTLPQYK